MFKRFTAGAAVGYVIGARAGQKRYDQFTNLAERVMEIPFVERMAGSGRSLAMDQGRRVRTGLRERAQWHDSIDRNDEARKDSEDEDDPVREEGGEEADTDDDENDLDPDASNGKEEDERPSGSRRGTGSIAAPRNRQAAASKQPAAKKMRPARVAAADKQAPVRRQAVVNKQAPAR